MQLYFDKLEIERFKSYREYAGMNLRKMGHGLWYVAGLNEVSKRLGSNGAGKSTVFDAIAWCLYGRTIKGHRTPDLYNWATGEGPDVSVHIAIGEQPYVIRRTYKANGLTLDDKTVTQERVDALLGMSFAVFLHALVLGQGKPLFFDLTPTAKMDVLSEGLGLDRWDSYIERAKKLAKELDGKYTRLEAELTALAATLDRDSDQVKDLGVKAKAWRKERDEAEAKREATIKETKQWLEESTARLGNADLAYERWETELRHSQSRCDQTASDITDASRTCIDIEAKLKNEEEHIDAFEIAIGEIDIGGNCPICSTPLEGDAAKSHRKQLRGRRSDALDKIADLERDLNKAERQLREATDALEMHRKDVKNFRAKSNDAVDERTRAQNRCNELNAQLNALLDRQDESQAEVNPYNELLAEVRKTYNAGLKREKAMVDDLARASTRLKNAEYWVEGFKLLRLQLIEDTLTELEAVTQTLIAEVGLEDWKVEYAIEKENKSGTYKAGLNVAIYQPEYERPINWDLFSGGEGQRLRLVGAVALSEVLLRRAGIETDFIVFDEPTRHLSPEGVRDTIDFLVGRSRERQVFYIDHTAQESNRFAGTVRVTRGAEGATLSVT